MQSIEIILSLVLIFLSISYRTFSRWLQSQLQLATQRALKSTSHYRSSAICSMQSRTVRARNVITTTHNSTSGSLWCAFKRPHWCMLTLWGCPKCWSADEECWASRLWLRAKSISYRWPCIRPEIVAALSSSLRPTENISMWGAWDIKCNSTSSDALMSHTSIRDVNLLCCTYCVKYVQNVLHIFCLCRHCIKTSCRQRTQRMCAVGLN